MSPQNVFSLTLLFLWCQVKVDGCTGVPFTDTRISIGRLDPNQKFVQTSATITGCLDAETLAQYATVRSIECKNQDIPAFHEQAVADLSSLVMMTFSRCRTKKVDLNAFHNLPQLMYLGLTFSDIETIDRDAFEGLRRITALSLYRNQIGSLENGVFGSQVLLQYIFLGRNKLEAFHPEWFADNTPLKQIQLEYNLIRTVQKDAFSGFEYLESINLSDNQIESIHGQAFYGLEKLRDLWLHDNRIKKLEPGMFRLLTGLTRLSLSRNNLTYISEDALRDLEMAKITRMTLHPNPWQCGCLDKINEWTDAHHVALPKDKCSKESDPVCVVPLQDEGACKESRHEDLGAVYYQKFAISATCADWF